MKARKGGAPRKAEDGLTEVIFTRCSPSMRDAVDEAVKRERKRRPGCGLSRSDFVREVLCRAIGYTGE